LLKASVTARLSFFLLASGDQAARSAYGVSCRGVRSWNSRTVLDRKIW